MIALLTFSAFVVYVAIGLLVAMLLRLMHSKWVDNDEDIKFSVFLWPILFFVMTIEFLCVTVVPLVKKVRPDEDS